MNCRSFYLFLLLICFLIFSCTQGHAASSAEMTGMKSAGTSDPAVINKLLGSHMFSLQWISWEKFGTATIFKDAEGKLFIDARQALNGDEVTLTGQVTAIDAKTFIVDGELLTKVSHINGGNVCPRSGRFTFKATGNRKYWRLQEMENPCDGVTDYVDVFF